MAWAAEDDEHAADVIRSKAPRAQGHGRTANYWTWNALASGVPDAHFRLLFRGFHSRIVPVRIERSPRLNCRLFFAGRCATRAFLCRGVGPGYAGVTPRPLAPPSPPPEGPGEGVDIQRCSKCMHYFSSFFLFRSNYRGLEEAEGSYWSVQWGGGLFFIGGIFPSVRYESWEVEFLRKGRMSCSKLFSSDSLYLFMNYLIIDIMYN